MKLQIADIATNERKRLQGFKVVGIFPFYLNYISVETHIKLCKIKELIKQTNPEEPKVSDFYNPNIQAKVAPLIKEYIITGLVNCRKAGWFFRWQINRKLRTCGHYHIFNLYSSIYQLDEPAFFLGYWKEILKVDNTLLKAVKPISDDNLPIKKKQG